MMIIRLKIITIILIAAFCLSCNRNNSAQTIQNPKEELNIIKEVTIENCEYFVVQQITYGYTIYIPVHKGNCKNPIHYSGCQENIATDTIKAVRITIPQHDTVVYKR